VKFIFCCILCVGAVHRSAVSGRCVLLFFWGVMLNFSEDIGYVTRHGNVTCPDSAIPFQGHARVNLSFPVSCELIAAQEGVSEVICVVLAHILDCKIIHYEGESYWSCFI
jgi:hypothetical protein